MTFLGYRTTDSNSRYRASVLLRVGILSLSSLRVLGDAAISSQFSTLRGPAFISVRGSDREIKRSPNSNYNKYREDVFKLHSMPELPSDVVKYSQVPKEGHFTYGKIPRGLLKQHSTKKGTWGIIRVEKGKLEYQINEPEPVRRFELSADGLKGVIEPTVLHQVKPLSEDIEFVVEFYRLPGTGPVNEKREGL